MTRRADECSIREELSEKLRDPTTSISSATQPDHRRGGHGRFEANAELPWARRASESRVTFTFTCISPQFTTRTDHPPTGGPTVSPCSSIHSLK